MKLSEYADKRPLYDAFARAIGKILATVVRADKRMRLQQVQTRAKELVSLQKKLVARGAGPDDDILPHAKDLAGCRLVFYTNADVEHFLNSEIMWSNFQIDRDRTKFHHPRRDATDAAELFESVNFVIAMKADRISLPEYSQFDGLWCEVQVQTILQHA